jgi:serine protein kinase
MSVEPELDRIGDRVRRAFRESDRLRSFAGFLRDLRARPGVHLRTSPQYVVQMLEFYGAREGSRIGQEATRRRVFDVPADGGDHEEEPLLVGQERAQEAVYQYALACAKRGRTDRMLLLHGPNGSGKTTLTECLMSGLERYSRQPEGTLLTFSWIFTDREDKLERIGFEPEGEVHQGAGDNSFAYLDEKHVSCRMSSELRESPLFLIPSELRRELIEDAIANADTTERPRFPYEYYLDDGLSQKNQQIYDALLVAYQGDWRRVLRHVQVERFYLSKRYRRGAVTIEPQGNIDAGVRPIQHENSWNIPPVLRNVSLNEPFGDIVDANRGVLEYGDFLKRPVETSKYLLTTCERGTVSLGNCMAYLDLVIVGTTNEKQLNIFKRNPEFSSFKGRIELSPVPYLLRFSTETTLYRKKIRAYSPDRCVAPHSAKVAALWATLTRLRRPLAKNYEMPLTAIVPKLTPIEKCRLYDSGATPTRFSQEERQALRAGLLAVRREFDEAEGEFEGIFGAEYEGRRGASPREMMSILARAAEMRKHQCLTPMAIFDALEELTRDTSIYDFLRISTDGDYHNFKRFLQDVRLEYVEWVTDEVYDSIELMDREGYERFFLDYFRHAKAYHTGETVYNSTSNAYESPDEALLGRVEALLSHTEAKDAFRSQIITRIAAWSLDHPQREIDYPNLFPEIYSALRTDFFKKRNRLLTLIEKDILKYGTDEFELLSEMDQQQVVRALDNMKSKHNYCEYCARDVIAFVLRFRSELGDSDAAPKAGKEAEAPAEPS